MQAGVVLELADCLAVRAPRHRDHNEAREQVSPEARPGGHILLPTDEERPLQQSRPRQRVSLDFLVIFYIFFLILRY